MSKRVVRVARLIIWRGERLLVQEDERLAPDDQFLRMPGGRIEPDEAPARTAAREFAEETGIEAIVGLPLYIGEAHFRRRGRALHEIAVYFGARIDAAAPLPATPRDGEHVRTFELSRDDVLVRPRLPERLFDAVLEDGPAGPATLRYVVDCEP